MPAILLIIGIAIVVFSLVFIKKEDNSFSKLVKDKEENSDLRDLEIAEIRRTFGETIADLQIEIRNLKNEIEELKTNEKYTVKKKKDLSINKDVISDINFNALKQKKEVKKPKEDENKGDKIKELIEKGLSDNEICDKLSVGKGEVLLVRSLNKN
ncbi:DUF6115 domain-containing protein [Clostridium chrysemydis]|uniref:DUF6115 domain-containing protein n=1 Tax=Clostridium chrysemydis TaxID=2665504 RepID=UPI0018839EB7|nr:hypothetical protein [Clostridium chrysemydis]